MPIVAHLLQGTDEAAIQDIVQQHALVTAAINRFRRNREQENDRCIRAVNRFLQDSVSAMQALRASRNNIPAEAVRRIMATFVDAGYLDVIIDVLRLYPSNRFRVDKSLVVLEHLTAFDARTVGLKMLSCRRDGKSFHMVFKYAISRPVHIRRRATQASAAKVVQLVFDELRRRDVVSSMHLSYKTHFEDVVSDWGRGVIHPHVISVGITLRAYDRFWMRS